MGMGKNESSSLLGTFRGSFCGRRFPLLLLFFSVAPVTTTVLVAEDRTKLEDRVKAAFLINFTRFVKWPEGTFQDADSPIIIGSYGKSPITGYLMENLRAKKSQGRRIVVKRFSRPQEVTDCNVLFLPRKAQAEIDEVIKALKGKSVLTVGVDEKFCSSGAMIAFFVKSRRVRFAINLKAVREHGLC